MSRIDKILDAISAHRKKMCEKCQYDGNGCINDLLEEAETVIKEAKDSGFEIADNVNPICQLTDRQLLSQIRRGRRDYERQTGHRPQWIILTRSAHNALGNAPYVEGMRVKVEEVPRRYGCYDFEEG